ncbi:MAG: hypothetical protein HKN23_10800, partial [Verrucomicrobiales bacterium]|nr:hypothetical protein [Verrucomicrobiales bacterium]
KGLAFVEAKDDVECLIFREKPDGDLERTESSGFGKFWIPDDHPASE